MSISYKMHLPYDPEVVLLVIYPREMKTMHKSLCAWTMDYGLWTPRRSDQSIPKEICPEHSLEELMLKLQYFDHLIQRADPLEKTLMLAKIEGKRIRGQHRLR